MALIKPTQRPRTDSGLSVFENGPITQRCALQRIHTINPEETPGWDSYL